MLDKHEHFAASHFTARKVASVFEDSNGETERFFFTCRRCHRASFSISEPL
jgi:hypothetical protein